MDRDCLPLDNTGRSSAVIYTFVEQARRHGAASFAYFEWVFEKLMHNPVPEELEALLPANWIKARPAASQTIECRVAWMPQPPDLWQKCERGSVECLPNLKYPIPNSAAASPQVPKQKKKRASQALKLL